MYTWLKLKVPCLVASPSFSTHPSPRSSSRAFSVMNACAPLASSSCAAAAICARAATYSMPSARATFAESLAWSTTFPYPLPTSMKLELGVRFQHGSGVKCGRDATPDTAAAAVDGNDAAESCDLVACLCLKGLMGGVHGGGTGRSAASAGLEARVWRNINRRWMDPSVISPYPSLAAFGSSSSSAAQQAPTPASSSPEGLPPPWPTFLSSPWLCLQTGNPSSPEAAAEARRLRGPSTSQSEVRPQLRNDFLST
mmetsp:Transcript_21860/g.54047  ORF Transcript_21860/g.54047 Transcript_21860/m.54047 type:complete len:254 (+) Transcript_21860:2123-2884(+)